MKVIKLFICIVLATVLYSCQEFKSKAVVNDFVDLVIKKDFEGAQKYYPNFHYIISILPFDKFKITSSEYKNGIVTVSGISSNGNLLFELKKHKGKWLILNTKGLSPFRETPLYQYCISRGFINNGDDDAQVSQTCKQKEEDFKLIKVMAKNMMEECIILESSSLENFLGLITGKITIKNKSEITFPAYSYNLYLLFCDSNGKTVLTLEENQTNYEGINAYEMKSIPIYETLNSNNSYRKIKVKIQIINDDFVESYVINHPESFNLTKVG